VVHDIAKAFWGSETAGDFSSYDGKALAAKKIQDHTYTKDSLGFCDFTWPITYSFVTPDHVGDPELEGKLFTAVTGVDKEQIDVCAERIAGVQRAIMAREGHQTPQDDYPAEFNFTEPLGAGPRGGPMMVPGPGNETVDATGKILDRDKFKAMLREYYRLRGWDEDTGMPRADTLSSLGVPEINPA
jgi:aldehyde:ferredoxin oxidoreductase